MDAFPKCLAAVVVLILCDVSIGNIVNDPQRQEEEEVEVEEYGEGRRRVEGREEKISREKQVEEGEEKGTSGLGFILFLVTPHPL